MRSTGHCTMIGSMIPVNEYRERQRGGERTTKHYTGKYINDIISALWDKKERRAEERCG